MDTGINKTEWIEGVHYRLDEDGPIITQDHEYQSGETEDGTPYMDRTTVETSRSQFSPDVDWEEEDADGRAWWVDFVCRYHALELALLGQDATRAYLERAADGTEDMDSKLEAMEAAYADLLASKAEFDRTWEVVFQGEWRWLEHVTRDRYRLIDGRTVNLGPGFDNDMESPGLDEMGIVHAALLVGVVPSNEEFGTSVIREVGDPDLQDAIEVGDILVNAGYGADAVFLRRRRPEAN